MAGSAPPWTVDPSAIDDRERFAAMTPEQRLELFVEVCDLARSILAERPDRARILADNEPMPPAAEATWLRLIREARHAESTR